MGCQCAKSSESNDLDLDKSPAKAVIEEENPKMEPGQSKAKLESADASKVEMSGVEDSKVIKKKKKSGKKKESKI